MYKRSVSKIKIKANEVTRNLVVNATESQEPVLFTTTRYAILQNGHIVKLIISSEIF